MGVTRDTNWQADFDHTSAAWAAKAPEIWDDLRGDCPVAHTERGELPIRILSAT